MEKQGLARKGTARADWIGGMVSNFRLEPWCGLCYASSLSPLCDNLVRSVAVGTGAEVW
jgi:hypothetical protein